MSPTVHGYIVLNINTNIIQYTIHYIVSQLFLFFYKIHKYSLFWTEDSHLIKECSACVFVSLSKKFQICLVFLGHFSYRQYSLSISKPILYLPSFIPKILFIIKNNCSIRHIQNINQSHAFLSPRLELQEITFLSRDFYELCTSLVHFSCFWLLCISRM